MMIPLIFSLFMAIFFAVASISTYGFSDAISQPWMGSTSVFLVLVGAFVGFLGSANTGSYWKLRSKCREIFFLRSL